MVEPLLLEKVNDQVKVIFIKRVCYCDGKIESYFVNTWVNYSIIHLNVLVEKLCLELECLFDQCCDFFICVRINSLMFFQKLYERILKDCERKSKICV